MSARFLSGCLVMVLLLAACLLAPEEPLLSDSETAQSSSGASDRNPAIPILPSTPSPTPKVSQDEKQTLPTRIILASPSPTEATETEMQAPLVTQTSAPAQGTPEAVVPLARFETNLLRPGVLPQGYVASDCDYLWMRWSPESSSPGTVVVPVMFHSIVQSGRQVQDPKDISQDDFESFIGYARRMGFETITTAQLLGFLTTNALIPARSMMLIVDDRRPGVIQDHFLPVLQRNDWVVTLAYIADPTTLQWAMEWTVRLSQTGHLDVQSHGYSGQLYIVAQTPEEAIRNEIFGALPVLEERFGQRPVAFIWPGGNFTPLAVKIAREAGHQLGFTAYSRGALLFDWIPLGEAERAVADPLMLLPRAWSNSASYNLDQAVQIGEQARAYAEMAFPVEAEWYQVNCAGDLPVPGGD